MILPFSKCCYIINNNLQYIMETQTAFYSLSLSNVLCHRCYKILSLTTALPAPPHTLAFMVRNFSVFFSPPPYPWLGIGYFHCYIYPLHSQHFLHHCWGEGIVFSLGTLNSSMLMQQYFFSCSSYFHHIFLSFVPESIYARRNLYMYVLVSYLSSLDCN